MNNLCSLFRGRSELGISAALGAIAVFIAVDTANIPSTTANIGVMGPQVMPLIVAVGLMLCAIALAIDVLRGGHAESEGGEDVDLSKGTHWPTLLGLAGIVLAAAFLMDFLGYVITAALMFFGSSVLLGSRRYVLALGVGIALALVTFYGFVLGIGIRLPAGILTGVL